MKPMKKACPGLAGSASGSKSPPATRAKALRRRGAGEGDKPEEEEEAQPQEQAGPEEAEEGEEEEAERDPGAEGTHPELQPNEPTPGLSEDPKGDGEAGRCEPSLSRKTATFKSRAPKKKYVEEHGTGNVGVVGAPEERERTPEDASALGVPPRPPTSTRSSSTDTASEHSADLEDEPPEACGPGPWPSTGTRHGYGIQTYTQARHSYTSNLFLKKKSRREGAEHLPSHPRLCPRESLELPALALLPWVSVWQLYKQVTHQTLALKTSFHF